MYRPASALTTSRRGRRAVVSSVAVFVVALLLGVAVPAWGTSSPPSPGANSRSNGLNDTTVGIRTAGPHAPDNRGNFHYEIAPGHAVIDYIAVSNFSYHPVTVRVLSADITSTTHAAFVAAQGKPHDSGAWIIPEETVVRLPRTARQIVPFQLTVPLNATPGDHPAAILISLLVHQPGAHGHDVVVDHRIGLRIYLRVPGALHPQLQVRNLKSHFDGGFTPWGFGHMVTDFDVVNVGNVTVSATQALRYTRWLGLSDVHVKLGPLASMVPGGSVHVHAQGGTMFAVANVDTRVNAIPVGAPTSIAVASAAATVSTFVLPWAWLVLAAVLYILWRLWRRWYRNHKAKKAAAAEARRIAEQPTGGKHRDPGLDSASSEPVVPQEDPS